MIGSKISYNIMCMLRGKAQVCTATPQAQNTGNDASCVVLQHTTSAATRNAPNGVFRADYTPIYARKTICYVSRHILLSCCTAYAGATPLRTSRCCSRSVRETPTEATPLSPILLHPPVSTRHCVLLVRICGWAFGSGARGVGVRIQHSRRSA